MADPCRDADPVPGLVQDVRQLKSRFHAVEDGLDRLTKVLSILPKDGCTDPPKLPSPGWLFPAVRELQMEFRTARHEIAQSLEKLEDRVYWQEKLRTRDALVIRDLECRMTGIRLNDFLLHDHSPSPERVVRDSYPYATATPAGSGPSRCPLGATPTGEVLLKSQCSSSGSRAYGARTRTTKIQPSCAADPVPGLVQDVRQLKSRCHAVEDGLDRLTKVLSELPQDGCTDPPQLPPPGWLFPAVHELQMGFANCFGFDGIAKTLDTLTDRVSALEKYRRRDSSDLKDLGDYIHGTHNRWDARPQTPSPKRPPNKRPRHT